MSLTKDTKLQIPPTSLIGFPWASESYKKKMIERGGKCFINTQESDQVTSFLTVCKNRRKTLPWQLTSSQRQLKEASRK